MTRLAQPYLQELLDLRDGSFALSLAKTFAKKVCWFVCRCDCYVGQSTSRSRPTRRMKHSRFLCCDRCTFSCHLPQSPPLVECNRSQMVPVCSQNRMSTCFFVSPSGSSFIMVLANPSADTIDHFVRCFLLMLELGHRRIRPPPPFKCLRPTRDIRKCLHFTMHFHPYVKLGLPKCHVDRKTSDLTALASLSHGEKHSTFMSSVHVEAFGARLSTVQNIFSSWMCLSYTLLGNAFQPLLTRPRSDTLDGTRLDGDRKTLRPS